MGVYDDSPLFSGLWKDEDETNIPTFTYLKILGGQDIEPEEEKIPEILDGWDKIPTLEFFDQEDQTVFPDMEEPKAYYKETGLDVLIDPNNMFDAFTKSNKEVSWKEANQRYSFRTLAHNRKTVLKIMDKTYKQQPPAEFDLDERGHKRHIKSHVIADRVVQRSLNDNILMPALSGEFIETNCASQLGKGLEMQRELFARDLRSAFNEYGPSAYVMFIDFSKFFDNIHHQVLLDQMSPYLTQPELEFVQDRLKEFEVDVSYMTDEEFSSCMTSVFNSLEYEEIDREKRSSGEKMMAKSVGIGSQTSQIAGLFLPNKVDHYCKDIKGLKYYGRYMDDSYVILPSKQELKDLLNNELLPMYEELGIIVNQKKTQIHNIMDQMTFLKINYKFTETGKLYRFVNQEAIHREQRRIGKFKGLYKDGTMTLDDIINCYKSWRGGYYKYNSKKKIHKLDKLFLGTFNLTPNVLKNKTDEQRKEEKELKKKNSLSNQMHKELYSFR